MITANQEYLREFTVKLGNESLQKVMYLTFRLVEYPYLWMGGDDVLHSTNQDKDHNSSKSLDNES